MDWFYHEMGARFSFQIKLQDTGAHAFLLPREQTIPTGDDTFNAMKHLGNASQATHFLSLNGHTRSPRVQCWA